MLRLLLALGLAGLVAAPVAAQTLGDLRGAGSNTAHYVFADPNDITLEVKVWGAVAHPGFYEVRQGLTLSTILSLAGGPQSTAQTTQTDRTFTIRLLRPRPDGGFDTVTETVMDNAVEVLREDPVLLQGDIVVAEETVRQRFGWRDGLALVSSLGTLTTIVLQIVQLSRN
ncbi:MAG: SLBB domain-containing protein [Rhodothermales bacterium]|nr:SLBB domain-containing protein [Rhodothermales bacterium]